jgi:ribosomal protein L34
MLIKYFPLSSLPPYPTNKPQSPNPNRQRNRAGHRARLQGTFPPLFPPTPHLPLPLTFYPLLLLLTTTKGQPNQRKSRRKRGYSARTATVDLWWEANVRPPSSPPDPLQIQLRIHRRGIYGEEKERLMMGK